MAKHRAHSLTAGQLAVRNPLATRERAERDARHQHDGHERANASNVKASVSNVKASFTRAARALRSVVAKGKAHKHVPLGLLATICLAVALVSAFAIADGGSRAKSPAKAGAKFSAGTRAPLLTPSRGLSVSLDLAHPGPRVPRAFLGLSFEMSSLHRIVTYAERGNLVTMLRTLGSGVLRFGGVSADTEVAWTDPHMPKPAWASRTLNAKELEALRKLAARSGWHVLLTLGLAHYDPRAAASEAAAAKRALGRWLMGVELGNEPDAYARHGLRPEPWTFSQYDLQASAYRRAIERVAPGIAIVAPDVSGSLVFDQWGRGASTHDRPALLTGHHYPLGCHSVPPPTIARLLSMPIRRAEDLSLHRYMVVSSKGALPFRLDEANSVSCGGKAGISDRFASALWAVDYIANAMVAGLAGINLQGNPSNCNGYTPLCAPSAQALASGALSAQPEWYSLLMSRALLGDRPVRAILSPSSANVDVLALVGEKGVLHLLIVDDEPLAAGHVLVHLRLGPRFRRATDLRLTAPSPAASFGVRLGGRLVKGNGTWRAPIQTDRPIRSGTIAIDVAPASATLVTATP